jgi:adenylylsulfate kinase-like enzyme
MSFAVWLTGFSGSGKSAIARALMRELDERGVEVSLLESDVMRTQLTPHARYDSKDRDFFYGALGAIAALLVGEGRPVLIDGEPAALSRCRAQPHRALLRGPRRYAARGLPRARHQGALPHGKHIARRAGSL